MPSRRQIALSRSGILRKLRQSRRLLDRYSVRKIGLFGSFATGRQRAGSDIDFLVEFERPTYDNFIGLTRALEKIFGRKIEVLTPGGLDSIRVPAVADGIRETLAYA